MVSRAAGADEHEGYEDAQGNWRVPHKLMMVQVHAGWCRVCKGLQPRLLKLIAKHPEVLCCKINKTHHEASVLHPNRSSLSLYSLEKGRVFVDIFRVRRSFAHVDGGAESPKLELLNLGNALWSLWMAEIEPNLKV